jgi:hypothetical protein
MFRIFAPFLLLVGGIAVQSAQAAVISGDIAVRSVASQNVIGFLGLTGAQDRYVVGNQLSADTFQFDTAASPFTILDADAPASHPFLAGLISPGIELLTSNSNAAIFGGAPVTTAIGSPPQSGGSVSIPGSEYETALWSVSGNDLLPRWVNHDGSLPSMSIVWDSVGQTLYLTANPSAVVLNHPGSEIVMLSSTALPTPTPEPSTFALLVSGVVVGLSVRKRNGAR